MPPVRLRLAAPAVLARQRPGSPPAPTRPTSAPDRASRWPDRRQRDRHRVRALAQPAQAGTVTFEVSNAGTKVNEFYVYAEGDRIISEVENITPGLKRELKVEITEPGTFTTACKPGMVGDGIRAPFTVTGTLPPRSADEKVATAIADYKAFVATQSDELLTGTEKFVAARQGRRRDKAKELYPTARSSGRASSPSPRASATSTPASTAARTSSRRA